MKPRTYFNMILYWTRPRRKLEKINAGPKRDRRKVKKVKNVRNVKNVKNVAHTDPNAAVWPLQLANVWQTSFLAVKLTENERNNKIVQR